MERNPAAPVMEEAEKILEQLLEYTRQLASCASRPGVDIYALTTACRTRLADLEELLQLPPEAPRPVEGRSGLTRPARPDGLKKAMTELHERCARCIETLRQMQEKITGELDSLGRARRVVRAYGDGRG
jgi:hypothetical protein